jgi:hypothetical protein
MKTVILLEHEGQVKNCLKRLKEIKGQKLIIASSPFAMYEYELKMRKRKFYITPRRLTYPPEHFITIDPFPRIFQASVGRTHCYHQFFNLLATICQNGISSDCSVFM